MGLTNRGLLWLSMSLVLACGEDDGASAGSRGALSAVPESEEQQDDEEASEEADAGPAAEPKEESLNLDCPRGGKVAGILVRFSCEQVTVATCKDLSNLVLELADGSHFKFDGQHGQLNSFTAPDGQEIVGVWVKAGQNHSGDGPGYGERFDAPAEGCALPPSEDASVPSEDAAEPPSEDASVPSEDAAEPPSEDASVPPVEEPEQIVAI